MNPWIPLTSESQLEELSEHSNLSPVAIFKHSTRCSISTVVKNRIEQNWNEANNAPIYLIDLLKYRNLSNLISEKFSVEHESPQLLIIEGGICNSHASHTAISTEMLIKI